MDELKELAGRLGVKVREEVLLREVGYKVRGGLCRVRGDDVVFLDRHAQPEERLETLLRALSVKDLDAHYVSPELRRLFDRRAGRTAA